MTTRLWRLARALRRLGLVVPAVMLACDQPPAKEIGAAEAALAQARASQAHRYAPERLKEAEAALDTARRKVEEKDYRSALSSAMEAAERSRAAAQAAAAAKMVVRSAAEVARAEVQAALDDVQAVRDEAAAAKIPQEAFAELEPLAREIEAGVATVTAHLDAQELLEAQAAAAALKPQAARLPALYRQAIADWNAAHPKGRRGRTPPTAARKR